ncbi:MAG TPA: hypothetical protein VHL80_20210 [Polyangia bacterium]|nr:hypothetical protein [Polyangia bacterium]
MDGIVLNDAGRVSRRASHRRCARCGKVVSRRALVCRRCGKKQRVNPRSALLGMAGLFLIALFGVATANNRLPFGLGGRRVNAGPEPWSPYVAPRQAGSVTLTAAELWALYNVDAAAADARFKGKPVAVTGTVADVRSDYRGDVMLRLSTGDALETVRAAIVNHDDSGRSIPVRGQVVSLRCTGRGKLIGSPVLDDCNPI